MFESQDAIDLKQLKHSTGRIVADVKHLPPKPSKFAVQSRRINCQMCVNVLRKHAIRKSPFRSDSIYFPKKQVRHVSIYSPVHCSLKNDLVGKSSNKIYTPKKNSSSTEYAARNMKTDKDHYQFEVISKLFGQKLKEDKVSTPGIVLYTMGFTVLCASGYMYVLHPKLNFSHKKFHSRRILPTKSKIRLKTKISLIFETFNSQEFPEKGSKFLFDNKDKICDQRPDLECFQCTAQKYSKIIDSLPINIDELNLCHKYRNSASSIYELNSAKYYTSHFSVFGNDIFEIILDFCQPTLEVIIILLINLEFHVPFLLKAQEKVIEFWDEFYIEYLKSLIMKTIQLQKLNLRLGNSCWKIVFLMTDLIIINNINVNELNYMLVIIFPEAFGGFENFPRHKLAAYIFAVNGICRIHQMLRYLKDNAFSFDIRTRYNRVRNLRDRFSKGNHLSWKVPKEHCKPLIPSNISAPPALITDIRARYFCFFRQLSCHKLAKPIDFIADLAMFDATEAKLFLMKANILKAIELWLSPAAIKPKEIYFRNNLYVKVYQSFNEIYLCKNLFDCSHIYLQIKLFEKATMLVIIWKTSVMLFAFGSFKLVFLTKNTLSNIKASVENFYSALANYIRFQRGITFYLELYIKSELREQSCLEKFTHNLEWGKYGIKHIFLDDMKTKIMNFCKFNTRMLMIMARRYFLRNFDDQSDVDYYENKFLLSNILCFLSYEKYLSFANQLRILTENLLNLSYMVDTQNTSLTLIYTIIDYPSLRDPLHCISSLNYRYSVQCVNFSLNGFQLWIDFPFSNLHLERNRQLCADTQTYPSLCMGYDKMNRLSKVNIFCKYFLSIEQTKIKCLTSSFIKTYISRIFTFSFHVTTLYCNRIHMRKQFKEYLHVGKTNLDYITSIVKYEEKYFKMSCRFSICEKAFRLRPFNPKQLHNFVTNKETLQTISVVKGNDFGELWGDSVSLKQLFFGLKNKSNFLKSDLFLNTSPATLLYLKSSTTQFFKSFLNEIPILNMTYSLCKMPVENSSKPERNDFFDVPCHLTESSPKRSCLDEYSSESEIVVSASFSDAKNFSNAQNNPNYRLLHHTQLASCVSSSSNLCSQVATDFILQSPPLHFSGSLTSCEESNHSFYLPDMDNTMQARQNSELLDISNVSAPTYAFMKDSHYHGDFQGDYQGDTYSESGQAYIYPQPIATLKKPMIQRTIPYLDMNSISNYQAVNFPQPIANGYESLASKFHRKPIPHFSDSSLKETSMRRKTKRYHRKFSAFPPDPEFEAAFRRTMVEQFATFTNYPFEFSKWCLEWSQWDYGKAAQTFIYNDARTFNGY